MSDLVLEFSESDLKESPEARKLVEQVYYGKRTFDLLGLTYMPTNVYVTKGSFEPTVTTIHATIVKKVNIPGEKQS